MHGLLLCDDMIFSSRITSTARSQGLEMKVARSADQLITLAAAERPACVIVDLANPGLQIAEFMRQLGAVCSPCPRVVGYGSHVDVGSLRAAREAGCDPVLPRSKFVEELPCSLKIWWRE